MSTVVERPMPAMSDMQTHIEIIDVDSFDREGPRSPLQRPPPSRNIQRRRSNQSETIFLIDSDEEPEALSSRVLSGHGADRRRSHRQYISPPPPHNPNETPPPLPIRNWQPGPAARRRGSHPTNSLPVLPSAEPFSFEMSPGPPVAGPSNPRNASLTAAPISRHVPALGFGGALISSNNRAQNMQRQARVAAATTRRRPAITNNRQSAHSLSYFHDELFGDDMPPHIRLYLHARNALTDTFGGDWNPAQHVQFLKNTNTREKEQYQQHYTHPSQPEPGFTFDFALPSPDDDVARSRLFPPTSIDEPIILDDDNDYDNVRPSKTSAGSSTTDDTRPCSPEAGTLNALLVCAKCLDPLVLNAGLAPEEAQYRRVWGLRCGHLIDEKCLNELGQPPQEEVVVKDWKGKGKAKAVPPRATYGDAVPELQSLANTEVPNIRSRLRSRPNATQLSTSTEMVGSSSSSSSVPLFDVPTTPPAAKKRRGPNKKPKIEGEFEWKCPVGGCGREHMSIKIDGIWGPETDRDFKGVRGLKTEARGAVAVFA